MRRTIWAVVALGWFCAVPSANGGVLVADLNADWSDVNNPNTATFGTWSYQQGTSLLPEIPNFTFGGSGVFPTIQPAWAPSNNRGDFLPSEFKAGSVQNLIGVDWQVGDVVVHTTDSANGDSNGPASFLWTSPNAGTVRISGSVWQAATLAGRDNSWSLLVNGSVVSSGDSIDTSGPDRAHPFLFSNGTGGTAALTQNVAAGSTIDLQITERAGSSFGYLVGANFTITESASVPEPSSLVILIGIGVATLAMTWLRAIGRRWMTLPRVII